MQEIRRGILLAKHDTKVADIRAKYGGDPSGILSDWLSVYEETEWLIIGKFKLTRLTMKAYHRTIDRIRARQD